MSDAASLYEVMDRTWPAARTTDDGPWRLREGQRGGNRVSATTAIAPVSEADIPAAEAAMRALGQPLLFQIREGDAGLDALLGARGYRVADPVNMYAGSVEPLAQPDAGGVGAFDLWEPLQIQYAMWRDGGIGPGRWAVMDRAPQPKTSILARYQAQKGATAFVSIHDGTAMLHALEVDIDRRRMGVAKGVLRCAARWARAHDATRFAAVCTRANTAANALYASMGLPLVGQYHYRLKEE